MVILVAMSNQPKYESEMKMSITISKTNHYHLSVTVYTLSCIKWKSNTHFFNSSTSSSFTQISFSLWHARSTFTLLQATLATHCNWLNNKINRLA